MNSTFKVLAALALTVSPALASGQGDLIPRQPVKKTPTSRLNTPADATGKLLIKFTDAALARAAGDGSVRSVSQQDLTAVNNILQQFGMKASLAFGRKSEAQLASLQTRAAHNSGKAQPDLAGMMFISGPPDKLALAAQALNDLPIVEWVQFMTTWRTSGGGCMACGDPVCASCFAPHLAAPFCNNANCCETVCAIDPTCCDVPGGNWDEFCVAAAHLFCAAPPADRCLSALNESCFEAHSLGGCVDSDCCHTICNPAVDPFCCEVAWDDICVTEAHALCLPPGGAGATSDLTSRQGYLRPESYAAQPGGIPVDMKFPILPPPPFPGYTGEGWNLLGPGYPLVAPTDPYAGLYGLSRQLFEVFGVGETSPLGSSSFEDLVSNSRGRSIRVGVIEWAFYGPEPFTDTNHNGVHDAGEPFSDLNHDGTYNRQHEDLDVTSEPGQTLLILDTVTEPDHATACLGIMNAKENGMGVTGIAPEAKAYFFPLTSVEEGPRDLAAWASSFEALGAGDVISCSFGPAPTNLNCQQGTWTLIRLGSDLGITICVAAGNSCFDLDNAQDFGDSGGIVVGAGSPGNTHYRLPFSNFYQNGNPAVNGNVVHIQAWGESVASTGFGTLRFPGGDKYRAYTNTFNGTSAATPQIAGLAADLQGLAKQFYGIPLRPEQIRAALGAGGYPQQAIIDPGQLPGFNPSQGCAYDQDPDEGPNKIGPYPFPAGDFQSAASFILNQVAAGFGGSPLIDSVTVLRGQHVLGNIFSLKASENNWFVVRATSTTPTSHPQPGGPASSTGGGLTGSSGGGGDGADVPAPLPYRAFGNITDILVGGHLEEPTVEGMNIVTEAHTTASSIGIMFIEGFNWHFGRWDFIDFRFIGGPGDAVACTMAGGILEPGFDCTTLSTVVSPNQFINPQNNRFFLRFWTVVPGQLTMTAHSIRYDFIGVTFGPSKGKGPG